MVIALKLYIGSLYRLFGSFVILLACMHQASVVTRLQRQIHSRLFSVSSFELLCNDQDMSHQRRRAGHGGYGQHQDSMDGMSHRRGRAGYGQRGTRGRGHGPPPGLRGREIGLYYAKKSKEKNKDRERNSRAIVSIDHASERNISQILSDVRRQSESDVRGQVGSTSSSGATGWSSAQGRTSRSEASTSFSHTMQDWAWSGVDVPPLDSRRQQELGCERKVELMQPVSSCLPRFSSHGEEAHRTEEGTDDSGLITSSDLSGSLLDQGPGFTHATPFTTHTYTSTDIDRRLMDELMAERETNINFKKMLGFRQRLPSWKAQDELLGLMKGSQVSVISGETGCGKTTQKLPHAIWMPIAVVDCEQDCSFQITDTSGVLGVPQFILDDAIMNGWGSKCHVICTQPRRISAISVAKRVAAERGETLGQSAGYQIRLESTLPRTSGSILYCTTGVLLRKLIGDPTLREVSHVIMDEVHERNVSSDFLTIIMKDLLIKRPDLKLILMSATINADLFSEYFNNAPMYTIKNVAYPVTEYFLEDILAMTNYRPESKQYKPHPRYANYGKGQSDYRKEQEQEEEKKQYLRSLEANRTYPLSVIEGLRNFNEKVIDLNLLMDLLKYICLNWGEGAILIFLPGWDTISKLNDMLKASPMFSGRKNLIIPLHSMMPTSFQQTVFDRPPQGVRKIVIATNIAETSITIDDVVFVVDCGKVKETTYDAARQMACLDAVSVSKAAARQRRGRAGRVQAGHCFHMFTKFQHEMMAEFQQAEMLRTPLEELVLQIKILKLGNVIPFLQKAIEPPNEQAVSSALKCLRDLNALTDTEELTPLGHHLANLPVNPRIGKIILFSAIFSCLDPVLTIASSLGFKEPFVIPLHKQEEADALKRRFAGDSRSDHIALLRAFQGWEVAKLHGNAHQFCWDNFLANNTLELLRNMKGQFAGLLHNIGFLSSANPKEEAANSNSKNLKLVKAVLCAGLYPNVIKIETKRPGSSPKLFIKDGKVKFHPKSVNYYERDFDSKYMIYHVKMKSSAIFIHDSSLIPPFPLLFFGGNISVQRDQDQETIAVDDWIIFQASQHTAKLVQEMRQQLDSVLQQKVAYPRMELYNPLQYQASALPTSQLIQAIIDLITREDYSDQAARVASGRHLYIRGK